MRPRSTLMVGLCAALLLGPREARPDDLEDFFTNLVSGSVTSVVFPAVIESDAGAVVESNLSVLSTNDYGPGAALANVSNAAFSQFQQLPLGSTVAGFTYEFDPALAIFVRSTQGLGPLLAERAQTNGKGKLNLSFGYSHVDFDVFEGNDLSDINVLQDGDQPAIVTEGSNVLAIFPDASGSFVGDSELRVIATENIALRPGESLDFQISPNTQFLGAVSDDLILGTDFGGSPPPEFQGSYSLTPTLPTVGLDAGITVDLFTLATTFGLTDTIDVGLVIPILRIDLEGKLRQSGTFDEDEFFNNQELVEFVQTASDEQTKTGIGDIILRGKARFFESDYGDVAARMDVSLPTGKEEDLMGRGNAGVLQQLIVSETFFGRLSPHVNAGFFFDTGDADQNQFRYVVGADMMLHERVTVAGDIIGSHDLKPDDIGDDQVGVSAGMKFNPWSRLVLSGGALVRLNSEGLRADLIPSGAIEYTFF